MLYKSIVHELIQHRPDFHDQLRKERKLLPTLENVRPRTENQPRGVAENAPANEAGQQPWPDSERGDGSGIEGNGGPFALRVLSERQRTASPRRGDAFCPPSHVARLTASRNSTSLFSLSEASRNSPTAGDFISDDPSPTASTPPGALSNGTVLSPPVRASGNSVPPEGLPQVSAGTVARERSPG